ncbi:MAG TPA: SHOCT domain-containing protein [Acidimicrobiales bacterium]|nr:SHOCT domain-containing protein [Acidimicrobiales bacterium]
MLLAADWGVGQVFFSLLWFFLFFIWIWLLISVFGDIFRSRDLSGVAKAIWVVFVIVLPYLGVFLYLIIRGNKMSENAVAQAQAQEAAFRDYVRDAAGTGSTSTADELTKLAALRDQGVIDEAEFARMKAKLVG